MQGPGLWRSWPVDYSPLSIKRPATSGRQTHESPCREPELSPAQTASTTKRKEKISMSKHSARRGSKCQGSAVPMTRHTVTLGALGRPRSKTLCISGPRRCREQDRRDIGALLGRCRCVCVCPAAKSAKSGKREGQTCVTQGGWLLCHGVACQRSTVEPRPTSRLAMQCKTILLKI